MINHENRRFLLRLARETISAALEKRDAEYAPIPPELDFTSGAFVTLKIKGALRGCIGNMRGTTPICETIIRMASASAFEDPRFMPLNADELSRIEIEITILSPLSKVKTPAEIEVGRHGLMVRQHGRSGVLLPQVPVEQGWDRETFLGHTCLKAGLPDSAWRDPDTMLEKFEGIVFSETEL